MDDRSLLPGWDAVDETPGGSATPRVRAAIPRAGAATEPRREPGTEPRREPATAPPSAPGTFGLRILAVSDVARAIREAVRSDPRLADVWVEGEVGRVTVSSAGHAYFTIKDARSTLNCVWFNDDRLRSAFQPGAGLRIVVHGRIDLFEQQGAVQLYVESIQPAGFGDLAIRFEALKARLAAEGLFDPARKRPLPPRPAVIAVITSPTGVVWHDIATVLTRRWPMTQVLLVPCKVQGEGSAESIVRAFGRLERWIADASREGRIGGAPQLTILARGGGSLEDLWSFNDERVVRAVVGHPLPVVCGVGHEVDVTLADFAADVRAATPSAAAELVVPDRADWMAAFRRAGERTIAAVTRVLEAARREIAAERRALDRLDPRAQLAADRERAGLLLDRAVRAADRATTARRTDLDRLAAAAPAPVLARIAGARAVLDATASALAVLDPQATLERGYAIVRAPDARILRDPADAPAGTRLAIRLAGGDLPATADER